MTPLDEIDRAFVRFQRSGSPRDLAAVYDALAPELLRLALHTTGQASDAEDVLQATFVTAIERAASFDPARRVLPWLTSVTLTPGQETKPHEPRARPGDERRRGTPVFVPSAGAELPELELLLARND